MEILRVAQKVYPDVQGGAPYHVHAMSRDQAAMGHDVTVLSIRHEPSLPHVETRDGYSVVRFDPVASPLGNALSPALASFLRRVGRPDVLHAHSHLYAATNLAAFESTLSDVPLAITNHGLFSQNAPRWLFDGYLRSLGRWTFDAADVVFCYTDVDRERLASYGVSSDVAVVPNGVDTSEFTPEGPTSDRIEPGGAAVVFVGRLVRGKRPDEALSILERVRRRRPDATLYICGDGPLRAELVRQVGEDGGVVFLGHVPAEEMPALYRSVDALVLPSRAEGLPRTVLEAQACGVPVVASSLDQLRSVQTHVDRLVEPGDLDGFADAVCSVIEDPQPIAANDGRQVDRSWERTVEETTRVLSRLAESGS